MPAYDSNLFDPPAPVAVVSVRDPTGGSTVNNVPMLIDSGSDVTLVPRASVVELSLQIDPNAGYELEGFDGHRIVAQVAQLDLIFAEKAFRGKYVIADSNMGILGRDVLNHVAVLLDGPRLSWDEQKDSPE
jgi:hypothetical protein